MAEAATEKLGALQPTDLLLPASTTGASVPDEKLRSGREGLLLYTVYTYTGTRLRICWIPGIIQVSSGYIHLTSVFVGRVTFISSIMIENIGSF